MFNNCFEKLIPSLTEVTGSDVEAKAIADQLAKQYTVEYMSAAKSQPELSNQQLSQIALAKTMDAREAAATRLALNTTANAAFMESLRQNTNLDPDQIIDTVMHNFGGGKTMAAETRALGIQQSFSADLNLIRKGLANSFLGMKQNAKNAHDFVRALYGDLKDVSPEVRAAAKAWVGMTDVIRNRANAAGAFINDNPLWRMPQAWSRDMVLSIGKTVEESRNIFVNDMISVADWTAYAMKLGGMPTESQLREYLSEAFNTIVTNGYKAEGDSVPGGASTANLMGGSRALFIKDADGWVAMQNKYSDKGLLEIIEGHTQRAANIIALMETFGPNAAANAKKIMSESIEAKVKADPTRATELQQKEALLAVAIEELTGTRPHLEMTKAAEVIKWMRGASALKLGSALLTSMTDTATIARMNTLWENSDLDVFLTRVKSYSNRADYREFLEGQQLAVATFNNAVYRSAKDLATRGRMQAAAQFQLKLSLLPHFTQARKEAFHIAITNTLTKMTDKMDFGAIDGIQKKLLDSYGINETDWAIWKAAKRQDAFGVANIMTPKTISEVEGFNPRDVRSAQEKLIGLINMEDKLAIVEPTLRNRAKIDMFLQSKTSTGQELIRAVLQFKGFPIAFMANHYARSTMLNTKSRFAHGAMLITSMTLMGGLAMQLQQLSAGKDPRNMKDPRFFGAAFLKSGALGVYSDFLYTESSFGKGLLESLAGPVISDTASIVRAAQKAAYGKDDLDEKSMDFMGDILRTGKSYVPGSSLWYTKALMNHYIFTNLQDMVSPGYSDRVQRKMRKEYGQQMYWSPSGELRAPDLAEAWQ